jgi:hypothetical protein
LGGNTVLTYWVKVIDPLYALDTYGVYVSQGSTDPNDFTQVFQETLNSSFADWTERTIEIPQTGNCRIAFRHFDSYDQYIFCIDDIIVVSDDPGSNPCPAVTNLKAEVQGADVVLTWDAAEGSPTGYTVYLDSEEKTTVTILEHVLTDIPGGKHTASVRANYSDDCTPQKVTTPEFEIGNCDGVENFTVAYNADCEAVLSWDAPAKKTMHGVYATPTALIHSEGFEGASDPYPAVTNKVRSEVLWDNAMPTTTSGLISVYWEGTDDLVQIADDFDAEAGWSIESITTSGFNNNDFFPYKFGVRFYTDDGGKPGEEIWIDEFCTGTEGDNILITLSEPFEIATAGKYWMSMYGMRTQSQDFNYRWDFYTSTTGKGEKLYLRDHSNLFGSGTNWMPVDPSLVPGVLSVTFVLNGTAGGPANPEYNVYRDGVKVAGPITETTYTDKNFDTSAEHEWAVAVVCKSNADSEWNRNKLDACDPAEPCDPPTNVKAEISDYNHLTLTWEGNADAYKITENGVELAGTHTSPYTATLESGEYEYCVISVCGEEESEPMCAEKFIIEVGIADHNMTNVRIYPNPATSTINIAGDDIVKVEIYNVVGQMVEVKTGVIATIDVSAYNNGIYLFRVYDSNNKVTTQRIMVSK